MHQGPQGVCPAALGRHIPVCIFSPGGLDPLCPFGKAELARGPVNKLNPTGADTSNRAKIINGRFAGPSLRAIRFTRR